MSKEEIASRLRSARTAAGMTQKDVANALGMTYQAISNYERAVTKVESGVLMRLCQLYGISVPEILCSADDSDLILTDVERQLVLDFRSLDSPRKEWILHAISMAVSESKAKNKAVSDMETAQ